MKRKVPDAIVVVSSVDEKYLPLAGPVIASMAHFASADRPIDYRIFYAGPETALSRSLDGYRTGPVTVRLLPAPDTFDAFDGRARFPVPALIRLGLPELVLDTERVVYLDVDTVVLGDIGTIFDMDLAGQPLAAAIEMPIYLSLAMQQAGHAQWLDVAKYLRETIGLTDENWLEYRNSGVLVLDLAALRRESFSERARALLDEKAELLHWADQDVINILLRGRMAVLPPEWNCTMNALPLAPGVRIPSELEPAAEAQARRAKLVHFPGLRKPWVKTNLLPHAGDWWHFAKLSPTATALEAQVRAHRRKHRKRLIDPRVPLATWLAGWRHGRKPFSARS